MLGDESSFMATTSVPAEGPSAEGLGPTLRGSAQCRGPSGSRQTGGDQQGLWERFSVAMRRRDLRVRIAAASRSHSVESHADGVGTYAAAHETLGAWCTQSNVWAEQPSAFNWSA
jgi:hypothetical protein